MTLSAAVVAFVNAVLAVIVNFGVSLTETQTGSITVLVNAGIVLIVAALALRKKASGAPNP